MVTNYKKISRGPSTIPSAREHTPRGSRRSLYYYNFELKIDSPRMHFFTHDPGFHCPTLCHTLKTGILLGRREKREGTIRLSIPKCKAHIDTPCDQRRHLVHGCTFLSLLHTSKYLEIFSNHFRALPKTSHPSWISLIQFLALPSTE